MNVGDESSPPASFLEFSADVAIAGITGSVGAVGSSDGGGSTIEDGLGSDIADVIVVEVTPALSSCVELKVLLETVVTVVKKRIGCCSALLVEDSDWDTCVSLKALWKDFQ